MSNTAIRTWEIKKWNSEISVPSKIKVHSSKWNWHCFAEWQETTGERSTIKWGEHRPPLMDDLKLNSRKAIGQLLFQVDYEPANGCQRLVN